MREEDARTARLIGAEKVEALSACYVTVVGLGGVGGHCAEALARSGVGRLLLIDCDTVARSNCNRQLFATKKTVGRRKTDAAAERLSEVSDCIVETRFLRIDAENVAEAFPEGVDFVIDAVDSLSAKAAIACAAQERGVPAVSCMGAGNRLDASAFRIKDLYETDSCPLARRMRHELRKRGVSALPVVCSEEAALPVEGGIGSIAPVTGAAGLVLASYVLNRLIRDGE